ncbi:hypothetical protein BKA69DRAFT_1056665 [Paraphysoderma sedebokerense]|nr:hypothetical protein BKA69DRAFT_1056665 [Paraphysoderma sedebokerense]
MASQIFSPTVHSPVAASQRWVLVASSIPFNLAMTFTAATSTLICGIVIATLIRHRHLLTTSHLSLINVAASDFLFNFLALIVYIQHSVNNDIDITWCQFNGFVNVLFAGTSLLSLTVMAGERYLRIVGNKIITSKQIVIAFCSCWLWCSVIASIPFITQTYNVPQSSGFYCLGDATLDSFPTKVFGVLCGSTIIIGMVFAATSYYLIYHKSMKDGFKWNLGTSPCNVKVTSNSNTVPISNRRWSEVTDINTVSPMSLNFFYQTTTGSHLSPPEDFICALFPLVNSIFNSLVILTMDNRWKLKICTRLKCSCRGFICQVRNVECITKVSYGSSVVKPKSVSIGG